MYVAIDFGSTHTRVASSRDLISIYKLDKFDTVSSLKDQRELIIEKMKKVTTGEEISFIGIGIHGMINKRERRFIKMPNYPALNGLAFAELLGQNYDVSRIFVENDAAVAALGEAKFGAGVGYDIVAYMTLSTGIGGARIVNQNIESGVSYEPGHQIIVKDGKYNEASGVKGDLEVYASGKFFKENYGISPDQCEDRNVWEDYASYLAIGVHNLINLWSPEVLVLGGGIGVNRFEYIYPALKQCLIQTEFVRIPEIRKSRLADEAGLYGAFALIKKS